MRSVSAFVIGLIFGLGIVISGMANPAKVLNFLDFAGSWDPSLAFVMGGALLTTLAGYRVVLRREAPLLAREFALPTRSDLDRKLIGGAALFGIGWGIAGFCPGAALPALGTGETDVFIFVAAVSLGILVQRTLSGRLERGSSGPAAPGVPG